MNIKIAHCFVHAGVESEYLKQFGEIHGYGLEIEQYVNFDKAFECDLTKTELNDTYHLGLFHPPCPRWARATKNKQNHPDLLDRARYLARKYCDYYIIENVEDAPLKNAVYLDGGMFNKPIRYRRGFETNFKVKEPDTIKENYRYETNVSAINQFKAARVKGYSCSYYTAHDIKKNSVPKCYLKYLLSHCPIFNID